MPRGPLVLVALSLALATGCQPTQAPPGVAPGLPTTPADPNAPSADRTLEYWEGISRVQYLAAGRFAGYENPTLEDVTKLLVAAAKGVEELPAVGVDPDAIEAAHGVAESMRRLARFLGQSLSAANGVQASIRLLFGDNGAFKEVSADARELRTFVEESAAKARKTRALLSSRYGREFPALDALPKKPAGPTPAQQLLATYQLFRDLERPTARQEVTRLKAEIAKVQAEESKLKDELARQIVEQAKLERELNDLQAAAQREPAVERQKALLDRVRASEVRCKAAAEAEELLRSQLDEIRALRTGLQTAADELEGELRTFDPSKPRPICDGSAVREHLETIRLKLDERLEFGNLTVPVTEACP